ncbi:YceI family protein [Marinicella sp. W31]|uniref:YceI family protein n=1 Tax=Marinicella sp. W31 TaxID=3023713 RepID=UPI00375740AC
MNTQLYPLAFLLSLLIILTSGCTALIKPRVKTEVRSLKAGEYALDSTHASLTFKVKHLDLSWYVGRFNTFDASLQFNPQALEDTKLEAIVEMASIDSNDSKLEETLRGGSWFDVEQYPQAYFSTQSVDVLDDDSFIFTGLLDWRGQTHPVQLKAVFLGGANNMLTGKYTVGFTASGELDRTLFGVDQYTGLVGETIYLSVEAEFQKQ